MLQPQFVNQTLSSFILWLDHKICANGGYQNYSGNFYAMNGNFSNYYSYGAVGCPIVADSSISGANIMTGVYLNHVFVTTGQSGLVDIDYKHGAVYFNNAINYNLSGVFSVKDFNIVATDKQDDVLLFKNKYSLRPKYLQKATGVLDDNLTYPIIFVKFDGTESEPFALGGSETSVVHIRCIILADSLYGLHAVQGLLQDSIRSPIALINNADMPFNARGGLKSGYYNYTGLANNYINQNNYLFLENVSTPRYGQRYISSDGNLNYDVFYNGVDFELTKVRDLSRKSI